MARFNAAKRESVWFDTEIRKTPVFDAISAGAFGLWTRLPFLANDDHTLPDVSVIAMDTELADSQVSRLMAELVGAGFLEWLVPAGRYGLSTLSQRYYSLSEPGDGEGDREAQP